MTPKQFLKYLIPAGYEKQIRKVYSKLWRRVRETRKNFLRLYWSNYDSWLLLRLLLVMATRDWLVLWLLLVMPTRDCLLLRLPLCAGNGNYRIWYIGIKLSIFIFINLSCVKTGHRTSLSIIQDLHHSPDSYENERICDVGKTETTRSCESESLCDVGCNGQDLHNKTHRKWKDVFQHSTDFIPRPESEKIIYLFCRYFTSFYKTPCVGNLSSDKWVHCRFVLFQV